ncbi:hypothetical protein GCM10010452_28910 [Crossiella cryophila]
MIRQPGHAGQSRHQGARADHPLAQQHGPFAEIADQTADPLPATRADPADRPAPRQVTGAAEAAAATVGQLRADQRRRARGDHRGDQRHRAELGEETEDEQRAGPWQDHADDQRGLGDEQQPDREEDQQRRESAQVLPQQLDHVFGRRHT